MRRTALDEVGGVAVETVTEDAHTALKMHRRGWNTVYLKVVQAAGLATESLSGHVGQRIRWARGMAQIFRVDNPLFGRGLKFGQRICYANGMLHFFYGIPRIIFLLAPIAYLFFGLHIVQAAALSICAYVLPHIAHANIANSRIQGKYRHSFWSDVYEAVLAWYVALPTTVAFINPRYGKFNVTAKGGLIEQSFFDWNISKPYLVLLGFNVLAFLAGVLRYFYGPAHEMGALIFNVGWVTFNLAVLGAAVAVATEVRQVRRTHRVSMRMPATLYLPDGRAMACYTRDFSGGGLALQLPVPSRCARAPRRRSHSRAAPRSMVFRCAWSGCAGRRCFSRSCRSRWRRTNILCNSRSAVPTPGATGMSSARATNRSRRSSRCSRWGCAVIRCWRITCWANS
ncbi:glycosyltransferase family 2 protein [Pandoraea sp. XY-2]|uniref:glycosyltransferase family 2 protein n=1 Tax=Pandoraea sp. XY-2 TaxID=2518599 RepID=UPI00267C38ED